MNFEDLLSGGNLQGLMQQAQQMQEKVAEAQARAAEKTAVGEAGAGMVKVTANGRGELVRVEIEDAVFASEDKEMLEDLVTAAANIALTKARELVASEMGPLADMVKSAGLSL